MKIAQVASLWAPVPPPKYGGSELIVSSVTEELVRRGHEVTLFASGDSITKAKLKSVVDNALGPDVESGQMKPDMVIKYELLNTFEAFLSAKSFDIIHSHSHYLGAAFSQFVSTPTVHTLHSYPRGAESEIMKQAKTNFCSISNRFQEVAPEVSYVATVYNGIDVNSFTYSENPENRMVVIGRMYPKKGIVEAMKVAIKSDYPLHIATPLPKNKQEGWVADRVYLEEKVKPLMSKSQITHVGEISQEQKSSFMNARALLFPISWEEPFGLVMVEAMACGTPVIAFGIGSVPEIIKDGKNGFIVPQGDLDAMVEAVKKLLTMDPKSYRQMRQECRRTVEKRFSVPKMVDGYVKLYNSLLEG